eukprot:5630675-Alexandrium_andersonii.AAC.1
MAMHAALIRSYTEAYGPGCWGIIYTADVRMRHERMERIRRRLASDPPSTWNPRGRGGAVFQKACSPSDPETQAYWNRE